MSDITESMQEWDSCRLIIDNIDAGMLYGTWGIGNRIQAGNPIVYRTFSATIIPDTFDVVARLQSLAESEVPCRIRVKHVSLFDEKIILDEIGQCQRCECPVPPKGKMIELFVSFNLQRKQRACG